MLEPYRKLFGGLLLTLSLALLGACEGGGGGGLVDPPADTTQKPPAEPVLLPVQGLGSVPERFTSELAVHGEWAYTGTWSNGTPGRARGNVLKVWNVAGPVPVLRDSLVISDATILGDVQISDDERLLVVATEGFPGGSIVVFDRAANPARPVQLARLNTESTRMGVHTAKLGRVSGRLYVFLSVSSGTSQLVVVDLGDPRQPQEVLVRPMGTPFIHDVFVRDGLLFTALWNGGVTVWDIGGGGLGGTPDAPRLMTNLRTEGGEAHNVWWSGRSATTISSRYVFVGQETPRTIGVSSSGDIHVVDISDPASPREVAYFNVPGAGTHNFSVDERSGILYAAYYNAGVRALDVRGDLGACEAAHRDPLGRCHLGRMGREVGRGLTSYGQPVYVWGVQWVDGSLFASDMLHGLFRLDASPLRR